MLTWPPKDPDEVLDYRVDWGDRLVEGEELAASTFTVAEGTVTIDSDSFSVEGVATVWLSGGTAGEACQILNRVETDAGRIYDQTVKLRIRNK